MKTLTFNLPDDIDEKEIATMLAAQLYDNGKLTLGQAATLVGLSKAEFMDELGKHGISIFGETVEDLKKDIETL